MLSNKLDEKTIYRIVCEAVDYEREFVTSGVCSLCFIFPVCLIPPPNKLALPVRLIGMNAELMCQYIEFVADRLLYSLGYNKFYHTKNSFDFMLLISLQGKTKYDLKIV